MRTYPILALSIIAIVFISGCLGDKPAPKEGSSSSQERTQTLPELDEQQGDISVRILGAPKTVTAGNPVTFSWKIEGANGTITHTAVYYDYFTHTQNFGTGTKAEDSGYSNFTHDFASGRFNVPNTFNARLTPDKAGTLYYRIHAIFGGRHYWTAESRLLVGMAPVTAPTKSFAIEADDSGFYINNSAVSSISLEKDNIADILLRVRSTGVYQGGLDFRGCGQTALQMGAGSSVNMRFSATDTCAITSYWPSTNTIKANLQVLVR